MSLIIRDVRPFGGPLVDIAVRDGVIVQLEPRLKMRGTEWDGGGKVILPGLIDHHIHLFATAAQRDSVDLSGIMTRDALVALLRSAASLKPEGSWIRATGFDETPIGLPSLADLDDWLPHHPIRIQGRTGALWLLNSRALQQQGTGPFPGCVERGPNGALTGRIWRGDAWLRGQLPSAPPSLVALGLELAGFGITAVTDTSATNGPEDGRLLGQAGLPQRLTLMGTEDLAPSPAYTLGPVKLMLDDHDLPGISALATRIRAARALGRNVAAHCVTLAELVTYLAALEDAEGAKPGDRIEHGGIIPVDLIASIAAAGLTVVTQPHFIHERGDRYAATVEPRDRPDLYRLRSLIEGGVSVLGGSDAPYGSLDPWAAMRAARDRRSAGGLMIGPDEAISAAEALQLYAGPETAVGGAADFCLLDCGWDEALADLSAGHVAGTMIGGHIFEASN
jgi:predicted amidohydrolase YtcJ